MPKWDNITPTAQLKLDYVSLIGMKEIYIMQNEVLDHTL